MLQAARHFKRDLYKYAINMYENDQNKLTNYSKPAHVPPPYSLTTQTNCNNNKHHFQITYPWYTTPCISSNIQYPTQITITHIEHEH